MEQLHILQVSQHSCCNAFYIRFSWEKSFVNILLHMAPFFVVACASAISAYFIFYAS